MGTWQRAGKTKSEEKRVKVNGLWAAKKKVTPKEMEEVKCGLTVDPNNEYCLQPHHGKHVATIGKKGQKEKRDER